MAILYLCQMCLNNVENLNLRSCSVELGFGREPRGLAMIFTRTVALSNLAEHGVFDDVIGKRIGGAREDPALAVFSIE